MKEESKRPRSSVSLGGAKEPGCLQSVSVRGGSDRVRETEAREFSAEPTLFK